MTKWKEGSQQNGWKVKDKLPNHLTKSGKKIRRFVLECTKCGYEKNGILQTIIERPHNCRKITGGVDKKVTIRLSDNTLNKLKDISDKQNITISILLREIINEYLNIGK
jgi:hypothetical protein